MAAQQVQRARPNAVRQAERRRIILDLRAAGLNEEQIAQEITKRGHRMTQQAVSKVLIRALAKMAEYDQADVEAIRQLDLYRIDQMITALWPECRKKNPNVKAIREMRALLEQRAKLLGTFAPQKHEVNGQIEGVLSDDDKAEIRRLEEAFRSAHEPEEITDAEVVADPLAALPPAASG